MRKFFLAVFFSMIFISAPVLGGAPETESAAEDNFGLPIKSEMLSVSSALASAAGTEDAVSERTRIPTVLPSNPKSEDAEKDFDEGTPPKADAELLEETLPVENNGAAEEQINADNPKQVDIYIWGNGVSLLQFPIIENNTLLLPAKEFLGNLGVYDFSVDSENQITVTYGEKLIVMNIGEVSARVGDKELALAVAPVYYGEVVYVPMRFLCEAFGFTVKAVSNENLLTVYVDNPPPPESTEDELAEQYINSSGISSDTTYLIWINKSKYTVYVFLKENDGWNLIYSCKCAIGTNETPTVTGTYKYFSKEKQWNYPEFYVAPIMRFYRGYAIHSTLLKYDGTNYNATVGKKLSHGCVRVRPDDINWLVSYVPLGTTVHITEK